MRGSRLFNIVSTLSKKECKNLIEFSECSINNIRVELINCFHIIIKENKKLLAGSISEKELFNLLFPQNLEFNDNKLRDTLYYANKVLDNYVASIQVQKNNALKEDLIFEFLNERKLYDEGLIVNKKSIKKITVSKKLQRNHALKLFQYKTKQYSISSINYLRNEKCEIKEALGHLDIYYFTEKLKWSHELMGESQYSSKTYSPPFLNQILTEINNKPAIENPFISIYYIITLLYKNNFSFDKFKQLKRLITDHMDAFDKPEQRSLVIDLHNYLQKLYIEDKNPLYIKEMQNVNEIGITYNVFLKNGKFNSHTAMNIVNVALRLNKIKWVQNFIIDITNRIEDTNALLIVKAMTEFHKKEYGKVLLILKDVHFVDVFFAMNAKSFLAKSYFMLKEYEVLHDHLVAMDMFYRRNKTLSKELKESNLHFVQSMKKITKHITTPSKLSKIAEKIEGVNNMAYKAWVQIIIKELLK